MGKRAYQVDVVPINLDRSANVPLFRQLYIALRDAVLS